MEDKFEDLQHEWRRLTYHVKEGFPDDLENTADRKECRQIAATLLLVQAVRDVRDAINNLKS